MSDRTPDGAGTPNRHPAAKRSAARRFVRLSRLLFFDGFRIAPGWMSVVTVMLLLGAVASTCYPLGYRLLVDGALAGSASQAWWGVAVVAILMSLGWVLTAIGATEAMALSDRIAVHRIAALISLTSGVPGIEHLERPEYLTEVEKLNANRRQLASAPRQVLSNLSSVARIVTLLILLATVSPWLLLLPVCAIPPLIADRLAKRIIRRSEDRSAHTARLAGMLFSLTTESASAGELRSYGLAGHLRAEHRRLNDELGHRSTIEAMQVLAVQGTGWVIYAAGLMGAIAFVTIGATDGLLSLGTVLMAVSLIRRSRNQLASTAQSSGAFVTTLSTADRLFWLEDYAAEQAAQTGSEEPPARLDGGIRLSHLSFAYPGTERTVLHDLSLDIPAGSTIALVGENGSGKTTLVKLLIGLSRPTAGEILVDGRPLTSLDPDAWRMRITAAFQDFARFQLRAVETVGIAELARIGDEEEATRALERAGASELVAQLPDGLSTVVGTAYTGAHGLSGGQWQKLALGRSMRRADPLMVLLDEPTASLDAHAEHTLFESYAAAARHNAARSGAITLLVSHRLSTVRMADLIVYLESGRIVETGSHAELIRAGGRYAELFGMQAAAFRGR
jgi:ATP-binding cassette subfamily B protein